MSAPRLMDALVQDVRFGLRQAARSPGLAVVIVVSLALGIGANTALFSVVNALLLRAASPVEDPASLFALTWVGRGEVPDQIMDSQSGRSRRGANGEKVGFSFPYPSVTHIKSHSRSFSGVVGFVPLGMFNKPSAVVRGQPMFVDGEMVTERYFETLGVPAARGRLLATSDHAPEAPRVGVISDAFWNRAFVRDQSALGTTIVLNGVPVTIVGVATREFTGIERGRSVDLWIPMTFQQGLTPWGVKTDGAQDGAFRRPDWWWMQVFGRVRPGVAASQASAEASALLRASFAGIAPAALLPKTPGVALLPGATGFSTVGTRFSKPLSVLAAVVALVLLVACVNVATLLLTRATARRKEMSVRLALGASRGRLFRQLLTEHALYALAGALAGLLFARWSGPILLRLLQTSPGSDTLMIDATLDVRVLAFVAAVSLLTTVLFGVVPATRAARADVSSALKDGGGGSARDIRLGRLRLGRLFVAAQIAMTVPLVVGAGLSLRTLANLQAEQLGFNRENVLLFTLDATKAGYKDASLVRAYEEMRESIDALPAAVSASYSMLSLVSGWTNNGSVVVEGGDDSDATARNRNASWNAVGPRFLETMGMRLVLGRPLDARDMSSPARVAVINETMARTFFGGSNPVGRRFFQGRHRTAENAITVVGVVADAKYQSVRAPAPPTYFMAYSETKSGLSGMTFEVRTSGPPLALVPDVRRIAARIAPGVPIGHVKTQEAQIEESLALEQMFARLLTFFGATALMLACIGLHGTMAYALKRRTREIGIRSALGADRGLLLRMALADTVAIAVAGIAAGGLLAAGCSRLISSLLFGVTPLDPTTIASGIGLMLAVAVTAGYVPARRASRIPPMEALREE